MTTAGASGFGTTFSWNGTTVAELKTIGGPKMKMSPVDLTSHGSTNAFKEIVAGKKDAGSVSLAGNWIPSDTNGQIAMMTDFTNGTVRQMIITGPGGAFTFTCNALITDIAPNFPYDKEMDFAVTVELTGVPVLGINSAPALTALTLTTATLIPTFAGGTLTYSATTTGTSYTVTPTCATADSITVNGSTVASGVASSAIATASVGNYALQVITIKAGYVNKVYNITVVKTS